MFKGEPHYTPEELENTFLSQKEKGLLYTVMLSERSMHDWQNVHKWCKEHADGYGWNGSYFHFKTKYEAVQFRMLWG